MDAMTHTRYPLLARPKFIIPQTKKRKKNNLDVITVFVVGNRMICPCSVAGRDLFTSSSKHDVDYLGQSTKGDLNLKSGTFLPTLDQLFLFWVLALGNILIYGLFFSCSSKNYDNAWRRLFSNVGQTNGV